MSQKYISSDKNKGNSFGGGDIIIDVLKKYGLIEFINSKLGKRSPRAEYDYSEVLITLFISQCRGAKRIENIYDSLDALLCHPRFQKGMSPDTFLYACKELSEPNQYYKKKTISDKLAKKAETQKCYKSHEVNSSEKFNEMLIDGALLVGVLNKEQKYTLDYDTTEIINKIKHSRRFYKGNGKKAYSPAVAMINNIPIYIENRNGDSNAAFNLSETIEKALNLLEKKGIQIETIRVDAAGFSMGFVQMAENRGLKYVTRAKSPKVRNEKKFIRNWTKVNNSKISTEFGDTTIYFGDNETRLIVRKTKEPTKEPEFWGLISNDFEKTNEEIVDYYAKRGDSENLFSSLNEFGWKLLPMRKFEHNTVYLYITAFNYILFRFITELFESHSPYVTKKMELKTFTDKFMAVSSIWEGDSLNFLSRGKDYLRLSAFT
ncbi:MAG: transposase [Bacteroidota bacterium]|nr:transposase [Bacteroidota bacterium]